jgi:lipopolysaccharide/colanic/teichoic acid biosynthesis glycosyltransferase/predicted protein tyrosine phosphatase
MNVLFVCTENLVRSPTAEALFRELRGSESPHYAYSVGIISRAPRRLTTRDIAWADLVAVMETRHRQLIQTHWPGHVGKVVVLDVSDHFMSGDASLREVLEPKIRALLDMCNGHATGTNGNGTRPGAGLAHAVARSRPVKRAFDVALAGLGLVLSAPLWALFALAIKLEDGGPVFYRQERVGLGGQRFGSLKFRSMIPDAEQRFGLLQAGQDDPRVTRVGRWLRATAMDELPQLWNIFRGDMSFVGPRALMPAEIEVNGRSELVPLEAIPGYRERHLARPGLTGLAQIYADRDVPRRQKFRYDLLYLRRQTLRLDLGLILLSFWISFRGRWEHRGQKF